VPDHTIAAPTAVEYREELDEVELRLSRLSEIDRSAFHMRVEGLSYAEIAAALGLSQVAARVKVHRARATLAGIR
jgi:RNA polymerase sigma factor (sigma-70 family)